MESGRAIMRPSEFICITLLAWAVFASSVSAAGESPEQKKGRAERLYNMGYLMTELGHYEEAILLLEESLRVLPTAEGYTYLGWTYSYMGDYDRAIQEAKKAISIDPEFGNPYNDIGVYLMETGKEDEAIPFLEKAMRAKRYCCYQFPHFNLGMIFIKKNMYDKARQEFEKALKIAPTYAPALKALELLEEAGIRQS